MNCASGCALYCLRFSSGPRLDMLLCLRRSRKALPRYGYKWVGISSPSTSGWRAYCIIFISSKNSLICLSTSSLTGRSERIEERDLLLLLMVFALDPREILFERTPVITGH